MSVLVFFVPRLAWAPANFGDFSVDFVSPESVTMIDPSDTLSFRVTNDSGSTKDIKTIFFNIDTSLYDFSDATLDPTGCTNSWTVQPDVMGCQLPGCISFSSGGGIDPGDSCTFDIVVTGAGDDAIFTDTQDQTDTLTDVVASIDMGATQQTGNFTLLGSLPTWQRKSLFVTLTATPLSVGVGDWILLTMNVTNRSNVTQYSVTSTPSVLGSGSASLVGLPIYGSSNLTTNPPVAVVKNDMDASQNTSRVYDTTGFPSSGTLLIGTENISYTSTTGSTFDGAIRGIWGTTAAPHYKWDSVYSQNTSALDLQSVLAVPGGETSTIRWIYRADSVGTVYFSAAANAGISVTSKTVTSNEVIIGDFTALVEASPLSVISGQTVTVTMTVNNNGSTPLTNIVPTVTPGGTTTATLVSGPDPASVSTLNPGDTAQFEWEYSVTGTLGQTFFFSGSATSDTSTSSASTSETGEIVTYSVIVVPDVVTYWATNFTFTWTVYNNGSVAVKEVEIVISPPVAGACGSPTDWVYQSNTSPANWGSVTVGTPVTSVLFDSDTPVDTHGILPGGSKDFQITVSCVDTVLSDTTYNFPVVITDKSNNVATVNSDITVLSHQVTLEVFDDDCTSPAPAKDADGTSQYCFIATLSDAGVAVSGETLSFSTTGGTLAAASGVTDINGQVQVYLTAPCSSTDVGATVTAGYSPFIFDSESVTFDGVTTGNLAYVSGTLTFYRSSPAPAGDINPVSIDTGDTGYLYLDVVNCGPDPVTVHANNDSTLGVTLNSPDTFIMNSPTGDVTVASLGTQTLTFYPGTIASPALQCFPLLTLDASILGVPYAGPYAFDKATPGDYLPDAVTVSLGAECPIAGVQILDWREVF